MRKEGCMNSKLEKKVKSFSSFKANLLNFILKVHVNFEAVTF